MAGAGEGAVKMEGLEMEPWEGIWVAAPEHRGTSQDLRHGS